MAQDLTQLTALDPGHGGEVDARTSSQLKTRVPDLKAEKLGTKEQQIDLEPIGVRNSHSCITPVLEAELSQSFDPELLHTLGIPRLMTEASRCDRFSSSFTLSLHHSRPKYTYIDRAIIHFLWRPASVKSFSVALCVVATSDSNTASFARGTGYFPIPVKALLDFSAIAMPAFRVCIVEFVGAAA